MNSLPEIRREAGGATGSGDKDERRETGGADGSGDSDDRLAANGTGDNDDELVSSSEDAALEGRVEGRGDRAAAAYSSNGCIARRRGWHEERRVN